MRRSAISPSRTGHHPARRAARTSTSPALKVDIDAELAQLGPTKATGRYGCVKPCSNHSLARSRFTDPVQQFHKVAAFGRGELFGEHAFCVAPCGPYRLDRLLSPLGEA